MIFLPLFQVILRLIDCPIYTLNAEDLTSNICKLTDKGSKWYMDLEHLTNTATLHLRHQHIQHYNASLNSTGMGLNNDILLSGHYNDGPPDNG